MIILKAGKLFVLILFLFMFIIIARPSFGAEKPAKERILFMVKNGTFEVPLENIDIYGFLEHSIGYTPRDIIHDGLPQFGSKRDDWMGAARPHKGFDIYFRRIRVIASASGMVEEASKSKRSGPYIKISHGDGVQILYIHLSKLLVKRGDKVKAGDAIAEITDPQGNGGEPQLHFELKIDGVSTDPLPLIKEYHKKNARLVKMISAYAFEIIEKEKLRERLLYYYMKNPGDLK